MMYCVRCGDKIDKGELVCDKCGLKFRVVTDKGTYVYVNQSVTPKPKKKKKKGWVVALAIVLVSIMVFSCCGISTLVSGLIGLCMLIDEDSVEPQVVESTDINSDSSIFTPTAYDSNDNGVASEYFDGVIRDKYVSLKGDGNDTVTVMVYLNGSDLESESGYATKDIKEMLNARLSDNVNVVIQTGGTKKWKTKGIASNHSQRFVIENGQLVLVDDSLDQLDITEADTLKNFINYCSDNYPANRNILILWDHGGGVVYGYGYDEHNDDYDAALTLDEIKTAIENTGIKFEMIGFDACLMGGIETVCALSDVADYLVLSEDFEPGDGWEYQNWLTLLGNDSSTPVSSYGKVIVDDYVIECNETDGDGVLSLVDLRFARLLYKSWTDFAYAESDDLISHNYGMDFTKSDRALTTRGVFSKSYGFGDFFSELYEIFTGDYTMESYCYAVDIMTLASTVETDESEALESALSNAICYSSGTGEDSNLTGLSVTLPYGDEDFFNELSVVFTNCGFDTDYIQFLSQFVDSDYEDYDWSDYDYNGWDDYSDDYDWSSYEDWDGYISNDYDWDNYEYDSLWYDEDRNIFGDYGYSDPYYGTIYYEDDGDAYYYDEDDDEYYYVDNNYGFY